MWGGRFAGRPDPAFFEFQRSFMHDVVLLVADLTGSIAWAEALVGAGVLSRDEGTKLVSALQNMRTEAERAPEALLARAADAEDVHTLVEQELGRRVGDLAKRLHTGRSRNDQVATDLKLWLRTALVQIAVAIDGLQRALVALADENADLPLPGYTHLQRAQPITAGHHALSFVEMLARDTERIADAVKRMDTCPLGSGALAGNAFAIDRDALAERLEFSRGPTRNSLDAVGDRDHLAEALFCTVMVAVHLSRLAEDFVFFASHEAGFVELSDAIATGSSLMPQKKNPDGFELLRGKTGRAIGELTGFLATLKGLPSAYDRDLQEDKRALALGIGEAILNVRMAAILVANVRYVPERCRAAAAKGGMNATDLADLLVKQGVPFRVAHERAGAAVRAALERRCELEELPEDVVAKLLPELAGVDLTKELSVDAVLARRDGIGGTAPERVRAEVARWRKALAGEARVMENRK